LSVLRSQADGMTVYKVVEVVGTSNTSFSDAVRAAVSRATETLDEVRWFEVKEFRGSVENDGISEFQAKVDVAFHVRPHEEPREKAAAKGGQTGRDARLHERGA